MVAARQKKSATSPQPKAGQRDALLYKVVELSEVDERGLEHAVNQWSREGYRLENVQFAMRESSRRPSMAFVFLTKPCALSEWPAERPPAPRAAASAWARLEALAHGGDEPE